MIRKGMPLITVSALNISLQQNASTFIFYRQTVKSYHISRVNILKFDTCKVRSMRSDYSTSQTWVQILEKKHQYTLITYNFYVVLDGHLLTTVCKQELITELRISWYWILHGLYSITNSSLIWLLKWHLILRLSAVRISDQGVHICQSEGKAKERECFTLHTICWGIFSCGHS